MFMSFRNPRKSQNMLTIAARDLQQLFDITANTLTFEAHQFHRHRKRFMTIC